MIPKRKVGKSDLEVRPFVLGGNVFGWTADEKSSHAILDAYVGAGFDFIDTADVYSVWAPGNRGGESETIIGGWLKKSGRRGQVVIATKVGAALTDELKGLKKSYILQAADASLKRLQTDYIDLYFTHYDDPDTAPEETLEAYAELIRAGKVRHIAVSNMSPQRIRRSMEAARANGLPGYICLQPRYNLYDREGYESDYEPLAREYGMGVVCYYSLASGFLTGKYRVEKDLAASARKEQLKGYMNARGQRILDALREVAGEYRATPAQVALAWLLARPTVTAPIASVSNPSQLDILRCTELELTAEDMKRLDRASV